MGAKKKQNVPPAGVRKKQTTGFIPPGGRSPETASPREAGARPVGTSPKGTTSPEPLLVFQHGRYAPRAGLWGDVPRGRHVEYLLNFGIRSICFLDYPISLFAQPCSWAPESGAQGCFGGASPPKKTGAIPVACKGPPFGGARWNTPRGLLCNVHKRAPSGMVRVPTRSGGRRRRHWQTQNFPDFVGCNIGGFGGGLGTSPPQSGGGGPLGCANPKPPSGGI